MTAEIICVGSELLLGDILNTNAQYLSQKLAQLGVSVHFQSVVGDNVNRLTECINSAMSRSDLLIFSGGLGPTMDDLTKETVASAFEDTLVLDQEELDKIEYFFKHIGKTMTKNNIKQAMIPQNGEKIVNPNGTAPGVIFRKDDKMAILLPGPPSELLPMFENSVYPMLQKMSGSSIVSINIRDFGTGESALEPIIEKFLNNPNPSTALYAKKGEVDIRVTAKADSEEEALAMCEATAKEVEETIGDTCYGREVNGLEEVVVPLLQKLGKTVATAESCTGGTLSGRITNISGASEVFNFGCCTYANSAKEQILGISHETLEKYGAVSSVTAAKMAIGVAKLANANYGVGITGIAGPTGGTKLKPVGLIYISICDDKNVWVKKINAGQRGRDGARWSATQNALDMIRRCAQGLDMKNAEQFSIDEEIKDF